MLVTRPMNLMESLEQCGLLLPSFEEKPAVGDKRDVKNPELLNLRQELDAQDVVFSCKPFQEEV